ncbi:LysR family transcriptional regulator [Paraburkholderia sp. RP-4-7]|uniref:LysR family transcriptional regulator n=1 Tax=Paraburkholderia polaris TaxID=2728848 RepID=A0A848IT59_9BURK|nr:LysR family transcriptional regulator [Paraburkholderia polaris]NMM04283.1 LysR family transcriptional regulator [Paraburkholderia polaris]
MDILKNMKVFVRVAETGSFTAAARLSDIATGQVSRIISDLEVHLRSRLLNRTTRKVVLTDAGQRYLHRCKDILALVDLSEAEAAQANSEPVGVLRVHAPLSFGQVYVVPALTRYLEANPMVSAELTLSQRIPDLLHDGYDVSLRIAGDALPDSALVSAKICDMPCVLCAAPAYIERRGVPHGIEDLAAHACLPLVTPHLAVESWTFLGEEGQVDVKLPTARLRTNSADALAVALTEGLGIGVLPMLSALPALRSGALVRILDDYRLQSTSVFAIYASRQYLDRKIRTWIDFLRDFVDVALAGNMEGFNESEPTS